MRARPVRDAAMVAALFATLLVPLVHLTGADSVTASRPLKHSHVHGSPDKTVPAWLTLHFAHAPLHVHLHQGTHDLLHVDPSGETKIEQEIQLGLADGFAELIAHVDWPSNVQESIVEVTLEPDGLERQVQSAWGRSNLNAVLTFQW